MKQFPSVKDILHLTDVDDKPVTVRGWVRTRRDSKAGISFISLSDGSCFDSLQLVTPNTLDNYEQDVLHLTTGCAIKATGQLVSSPGQNQRLLVKSATLTVTPWQQNATAWNTYATIHT